MVYRKGTSDPTSSSIFPHVKKDSCLMPVWNISFQSPNHEIRPLYLQPSVRPSISPLKETFKRGKLKLHTSEYTCQWLKSHASHPKQRNFIDNEAGIFLVDFSQVDKHKPSFFGCGLSVWWLGLLLTILWCPELLGWEKVSLYLSCINPVVRGTSGGLEVSLFEERGLQPLQLMI